MSMSSEGSRVFLASRKWPTGTGMSGCLSFFLDRRVSTSPCYGVLAVRSKARWRRGEAPSLYLSPGGGEILCGLSDVRPFLNKRGILQNRVFRPHPNPLPRTGEGVTLRSCFGSDKGIRRQRHPSYSPPLWIPASAGMTVAQGFRLAGVRGGLAGDNIEALLYHRGAQKLN